MTYRAGKIMTAALAVVLALSSSAATFYVDFADNYPLASPPVFISTQVGSPDFYVPKSRHNPSWAAKHKALVETGGVRYPDFIGARMFRLPGATSLILR